MTQQFVELSEIIAEGAGSVNPASCVDEEFVLYSIPAFDAGEPEAKTGAEIGSSKQVVKPGDVLLSKIVPHIRRSWIVGPATGKRIIASGEWIVFRGERFDPKYLRHVLVGDPFHLQFMNTVAGVGGSLLRARPAHVAKIKIPFPPLSEQKRIAEILDRAEALRAKRRAALALLDELTQSIFLDMFGDPISNPKGWQRCQLVDTCDSSDDIKCGPFGTQLNKSEFRHEGVPLWGIKNVNRNFELPTQEFLDQRTATRLKQYSIQVGDIVMTRKGTVGNCAVYPDGFPVGIMHSDLLRLRVNRQICSPIFLSHQLHYSRDVEQQLALISGGAIMPGINVSRLKALKVLLPPIGEQSEFGSRLESLDRSRTLLRTSLSELDQLFAALQHRAFRGEL